MVIVVVPHCTGWGRKYELEAPRIRAALGYAAAAIHHIGSTAVPGILAKPIIDILVEVTSVEAIDDRSPQLVALGYEAKGAYGIPGRRYFRKHSATGEREFHLHVFGLGSKEIKRHLAFRDYLRAHRDVALEYSELKRELVARDKMDNGAYVDGKDPFLEAVVPKAMAWWRYA